jgi:UDP-galactopyranose mutase
MRQAIWAPWKRPLNADIILGLAIVIIMEHKHFEPLDMDYSYVNFEYPTEYKADTAEPYYPVNNDINNQKYLQYKYLADQEKNIVFRGRLAECKY